jgi:transcriptional regulator with XRE-family HTH domain
MNKEEAIKLFSQNLLKLRRARGWTQRGLAERANIPHAVIENIERGMRQGLPFWMVYQLAEALNVRVGALFNPLEAFPSERELSPKEYIEEERTELTGHEYRLIRILNAETSVLNSVPMEDWRKFIRILRKELPPRF